MYLSGHRIDSTLAVVILFLGVSLCCSAGWRRARTEDRVQFAASGTRAVAPVVAACMAGVLTGLTALLVMCAAPILAGLGASVRGIHAFSGFEAGALLSMCGWAFLVIAVTCASTWLFGYICPTGGVAAQLIAVAWLAVAGSFLAWLPDGARSPFAAGSVIEGAIAGGPVGWLLSRRSPLRPTATGLSVPLGTGRGLLLLLLATLAVAGCARLVAFGRRQGT